MFVSSCGPCPPVLTASHLNYWANGAEQAAAAAAAAAAANISIPAAEAASPSYQPQNIFNQVQKRPLTSSSFYISDILYPSVIPLPGTLPSQSLPASSSAGRSPSQGLPSDSTSNNSSHSAVKSSQLKFGIDRILSDGKKNKKIHSDCEERRGFMPVTPSSGRLLAYCPCTSASGCTMLYGSLPYPHQAPNTLASFSHNRQSDFPGPYAVLNSENHQQPQPKRKRSWSRAVFSNLQRKGLEKRFEVQKYVTKPDRRQLASMLGLTDAQVKVWFQNRRMKWRHAEEAKRRAEELRDDQRDKEKDPSEKAIASPTSLIEDDDQDFKVDISEDETESPDASVES